MKIKIEFFPENLIEAIGAGVYKVSVIKPNGDIGVLYIGVCFCISTLCYSPV